MKLVISEWYLVNSIWYIVFRVFDCPISQGRRINDEILMANEGLNWGFWRGFFLKGEKGKIGDCGAVPSF